MPLLSEEHCITPLLCTETYRNVTMCRKGWGGEGSGPLKFDKPFFKYVHAPPPLSNLNRTPFDMEDSLIGRIRDHTSAVKHYIVLSFINN